jgi:cytochrome b subunit of formate dehydrogenase
LHGCTSSNPGRPADIAQNNNIIHELQRVVTTFLQYWKEYLIKNRKIAWMRAVRIAAKAKTVPRL